MHQPGHELEQRSDVGQTRLWLLGQRLLLGLLSLLLWCLCLCLAEALCSGCRGDHLQSGDAALLCMCCDAAAMGEAVIFSNSGWLRLQG